MSHRTRRLLGGFVALEVAVGVALVASTGLMIRSYASLRSADAGFTFDDRLIVDVLLPARYADPERQQQWFATVAEAIRARGATGVAVASSLPLRPERDTTTFIDIVSRPVTDPHQRPNARLRFVSPDLFALLGTRVGAGRPFLPADTHRAQAVAIVNEAFVRRFLGPPIRSTKRFAFRAFACDGRSRGCPSARWRSSGLSRMSGMRACIFPRSRPCTSRTRNSPCAGRA